jgi:site-specific DNA recombinase
MTLRAAIFASMSEAKTDGGDWQKRQIEDGLAIAARKGATVDPTDVYVEEGSRSVHNKKKRREYLRMLSKIEDGDLDLVICWMEDRVHRQVLELAAFIRLCQEHNVKTITPNAEYDPDDPDAITLWFVKVRLAEAEVEKTSTRLRRQRLQAAESGRAHRGGLRAFGTVGRGKNKVPLARALAEQDCIREACDRIVAGDTVRGICVDWNKRRIPTALNGKWNGTVLRRTLLSSRIAGYREHRGTLYEATEWTPIVDREKWHTVRAILTDPARATSLGGGQAQHLLSGLIYCGVCGKKLYCRIPATKSAVRAYYCPDRDGVGGHVHRNAEKLEKLILKGLFKAVEDNAAYDDAVKSLRDGDPTRPHYEALARITADLDTLDGMLAEADLAERQGRKASPSSATLRRKVVQREAEREQHLAAVARLQGDRVMAHVPRNLRKVWPDLSLDRQRAILRAVFRDKRIVVLPQRSARGPHFDPDLVKVLPLGDTPA